MKSELLSQEKNFVTIKVTVDKADFAADLKKTYRELSSKVNIPGFRRGRVPQNILDMRIGRENIKAQTFEDMLGGVIDEICGEYELSPIDTPEVDLDSIPDNEDVVFTVKFEVEPEITLPEFSEITVDLPVFDVNDDVVESALKSAKKNASTYKAVERAAETGDIVRLSYTVRIKGTPEEEGGITASEPTVTTYDLDPMMVGPEILNALVGASAGDRRTAEVPYPADSGDSENAGMAMIYNFDIIEVQERVEPEMNEEFFRKVTKKQVSSVEELKAEIRANIEAQVKADARTAAENDALAKISEASQFDVPESMVKRQYDYIRERYAKNIQQRTKKTLEEYYADNKRDIKEFETSLMNDARRDVKGYLIIDACSKHFNVTVGKDDLEVEIAAMAANYGISAQSVKDMLNNRKDDFKSMINQARYRKTMDAILNAVKINEVVKGASASGTEAAEAPVVAEAPVPEVAEAPAAEE